VLGDRSATVADLPALGAVEDVVHEAMRLYPPVWVIGREALDNAGIGGHPIEAGTTIWISPYLIHRDPRWYDSPGESRPSRWTDGLRKSLPRFAYLPFGGGPRICIGHRFAMMETVLVLATILQRFGLEWQSHRKVTLNPGITPQPKGGV
jgi:cytochrome P450